MAVQVIWNVLQDVATLIAQQTVIKRCHSASVLMANYFMDDAVSYFILFLEITEVSVKFIYGKLR